MLSIVTLFGIKCLVLKVLIDVRKKVMVVVGVMKSLSESCFGRALMLRSIRDYDRYLICSKNIITRDINWVV